MTSLLTNTAAMSALRLLAGTQKALGETQGQVSTGLRVAQASDDAAYWTIGVTMRSEVAGLEAVGTGLDLLSSIVSVTDTAVRQVMQQVDAIKDDLVSAHAPGIDRASVQTDIAARQASIVQTARSASFNGVNWLVQHKTANIDIVETHAVQDTRANIEANADLNRESRGAYPTRGAPASEAYPTKAFGPGQTGTPGFTFLDNVTYDATAHETDANGTAMTEVTHFEGTDTDNAFSSDYWFSDYGRTGTDLSVPPDHVPQWKESDPNTPLRYFYRVSPQALATSAYSDTGTVSFSGHQDAGVPSASTRAGSGPTVTVDTSPFSLFTDYTGTLDVTESTTYSDGETSTGAPVFLYGHGSHSSTTPYSSIEVDNGFEVDGGALDTNIGGVDGSTYRKTVPEDDLGLAGKTTVLNFDLTKLQARSLDGMITAVEGDLKSLRTMSAKLGGAADLIATRKAFNASLSDALTAGIGSLVDADMNVASTRLQALQVQQQLGIQSLSIANANGAAVLKLFQAA